MDFLGYAYMALGFVVFVVSIGVGASVLSGLQTSLQTGPNATASYQSVAWNATGSGLTGMTNLASQSGNIGLILGAVIIIGLLLGAFMVSRK